MRKMKIGNFCNLKRVINKIFLCICLVNFLFSSTDEIFVTNAYDLVNYLRFDIMAKYIYAKYRDIGIKSTWPLEVYKKHIKVWGNFVEFGGKDMPPQKVGLDAYLRDFHEILDSIKYGDFDFNKSVVPVGRLSILNGAHRVTACLLYNKPVYCKAVNVDGVKSTASFLKRRKMYVEKGLKEIYLDAMALQYCEIKKDSLIIILFNNKSIEKEKRCIETYGNLVYEKKIKMTRRGLKNLGFMLRKHDNFEFLHKLKSTFEYLMKRKNHDVTVFLIDFANSDSKIDYLNLFQEVKDFQEDNENNKSNLYLSRTYETSLILAKTFFVRNSINMIDKLKFDLIKMLDVYADKCSMILNRFLLNSDLTCFFPQSFFETTNKSKTAYFVSHETETVLDKRRSQQKKLFLSKFLDFEDCSDEILVNPEYFFYYDGLKFIMPKVIVSALTSDKPKRSNLVANCVNLEILGKYKRY